MSAAKEPHHQRISIKHWSLEDRPREKLLRLGESALTDSELLAILLRTGIRGESALDLARKTLDQFSTFRRISAASPEDWKKIKGIGLAKIAQVRAAIEIGRRMGSDKARDKRPVIETSRDVVEVVMPLMRDLKKEVVLAVFLNSGCRIIDIVEVSRGTVNYVSPIIREILQMALLKCAASLVCIHNHPSGDPTPSNRDKEFTRLLAEAGKALGILILDHIVIGDGRYYSFSDKTGGTAGMRES